jgi:hypothetical protein
MCSVELGHSYTILITGAKYAEPPHQRPDICTALTYATLCCTSRSDRTSCSWSCINLKYSHTGHVFTLIVCVDSVYSAMKLCKRTYTMSVFKFE